MKITLLKCLSLLVLMGTISACGIGIDRSQDERVIVREGADPDMLNPYNYQSANSGYIINNIFQSLLRTDFEELELQPVLAKERPEIEQIDQETLHITYEIRPEARWRNGDPITAEDVEFSLKVMKNPRVNNHRIRHSYEFIDSMKFYDDNPRKFTFVTNEIYMLAESSSGGFAILPQHVYDPEGLMEEFTVHGLNNRPQELRGHPNIREFARKFNSQKHQREEGYVKGSGPYDFKGWQTERRINLERKDDWWGDDVDSDMMFFEANAPEITYEIINDDNTSLVALKGEHIDVMRGIEQRDFKDLPESDRFTRNYDRFSPRAMSYSYIGINMDDPFFEDRKVRQALAHLVDVEQLIDNVIYGMGERVIGPVHPVNEETYNDTITPYEFNISKARELLHEAGWEDISGDGILQKEIDGELQPFEVDFSYNTGNQTRRNIGLILNEQARRVGIDIQVEALEWNVFLQQNQRREFQLFVGGWVGSPVPSDPKQIWHTESIGQGSNYVGFGDAYTDSLIDEIRRTIDDSTRNAMFKELQWEIHQEVPYVFLFTPNERIAIHNRFTNAEPSELRPGYFEPAFKVREELLAQP